MQYIKNLELGDEIKCFTDENNINEEIIYEIDNNLSSNTILIQYNSIKSLVIYESTFESESSIIYSNSNESFGNYYLTMEKHIIKYYIKISYDKDFKLCLNSFQEKGNTFKNNKSIYYLLNNANIVYYFKNNHKDNFLSLRYSKDFLREFNINLVEIKTYFSNTNKKINITISNTYQKDDFCYLLFYIDTEYNEEITEILIYVNLELKENNNELKKFELELVNDKEISFEYCISSKNIPFIYFINLNEHVFTYDRDILFLTKKLNNNIFIAPFNNISNDNSLLLDKPLMLINKNLFNIDKYKNKITPNLLIIIIDEYFKNQTNIDFLFFGGYQDLIHYNENISIDKLFNNNNKILVKADLCRPQYFINYFNINKDKILDYNVIEGQMNVFYLNNTDDLENLKHLFSKLKNNSINNFESSIMNSKFGLISVECPKIKKINGYILSYDKNIDIIKFDNQRILLNIESNKEYTYNFEDKNEFEFRIIVYKKNGNNLNLNIKYNSDDYKTLTITNNLIFKHSKDDESKLMINSNNECILEIIQSIDLNENELIIEKNNAEKKNLYPNKLIFFSLDENINNFDLVKIELTNENAESAKLCIYKGNGKYPFLIKPICSDNYFALKSNYVLSYDKNIINDKLFYISILSDKEIKYSYSYEKETIFNETNKYENFNFNGKETVILKSKVNSDYNIYYQIIPCKINDFYFYFEKGTKQKLNDNTIIYNELNLEQNEPKIIFDSNGNNNIKFKYYYNEKNLLKFNEKYNKNIRIHQNNNFLNLLIESPFSGSAEINIIIISDEFEKYDDNCDLIDFYEKMKEKNDVYYYGQRLLQKEIYVNDSNIAIEINSQNILDLNNKKVRIFIINKLISINIDAIYKSDIVDLHLKDESDSLKDRNNNLFLKTFTYCLIIIFTCIIIYWMYRKKRKSYSSTNINFQRFSNSQIYSQTENYSNKL